MGRDSKLYFRHCGKSGHRAENCYGKPENRTKMEDWKKKNNDGGSLGYKLKCHICGETGHRQYQCSKVKCYKCGKLGHMRSNCSEKDDSAQFCQDVASDSESDCDIVLMTSEGSVGENNYWIADSGATCHMGPSLERCKYIVYVREKNHCWKWRKIGVQGLRNF